MGTGQMQRPPAPSFNQATRQSYIQQNSIPYNTGGGINTQQITQVGFAANLYICVQASVTTQHVLLPTNNNTSPIPDPYRFFKRIRLSTNEGSELLNLTGAGLYLAQRLQRSTYDPRNPAASVASTNTAAAIFSVPPSFAIDTTYNVNFCFKLPIALGPQLQAGLILLQNDFTRLSLEVTYDDAATSLLSTNSVIVNSVQMTTMLEFYNLPPQTESYPDLSRATVIREDVYPITNTGDFSFSPIYGPNYLDFVMQFETGMNGANTGFTRMTPGNFSQLRLIYSATQQVYNITPQQLLMINREKLGGIDMPDGVFWWGLGDGVGLIEIPNTRDSIDTSQLTDLRIISTINGGVSLTGAQVRVISRYLVPRV